jgi:fatty acid desaturase
MEVFYGLPFFLTVAQYQPQHRLHHARLGGSGDELADDYRRFGLCDANVDIFNVWIVRPLLGFGAFYVTHISLRPWSEGAKIVAFWSVTLVGFYQLGMLGPLLLYWFVPLLWSNYAFLYWSEVENHYNTRSGTRTRANRLYNVMTHNAGYHAVHHRFSSIPWFNLPRAHSIYFSACEDVSVGFLDTYRQLRRPVKDGRVPAFVRPVPPTDTSADQDPPASRPAFPPP